LRAPRGRSKRNSSGAPVSSCSRTCPRCRFDLFQGDAAFKPVDWRIKVTPAFNANTLSAQEVGVVSPDVRKGTIRNRSWLTAADAFGEYKIADLSPEYDFLSIRGRYPAVQQRLPRVRV